MTIFMAKANHNKDYSVVNFIKVAQVAFFFYTIYFRSMGELKVLFPFKIQVMSSERFLTKSSLFEELTA